MISIQDLLWAYRKVKAHLYTQRMRPRIHSLCEFERNLAVNLSELKKHLVDNPQEIIDSCKGFSIVPYRSEANELSEDLQWINIGGDGSDVASVTSEMLYIRTVAELPINCEIVFAHWVCTVGSRFDHMLPKEVFGGRLLTNEKGVLPRRTSQIYRNRQNCLRDFVENVIDKARTALRDGQIPVVIIAELRDCASYNGEIEIKKYFDCLDKAESAMTDLVDQMLRTWRNSDLSFTTGIPTGSCIAGILSNMALLGIDDVINKKFSERIFYGRCEKIIALVLPRGKGSPKEQFNALTNVISSHISCRPEDLFQSGKTRVCQLIGNAGLAYLDAIERSFKADDVVWSNMPDSPNNQESVDSMQVVMSSYNAECCLQSLTPVAMSRRKFVKLLADMESYLANVHLADWKDLRIHFLNTVRGLYSDASSLFKYFEFYPRVLSVAFSSARSKSSEEYKIANNIVDYIMKSVNALEHRQYVTKLHDEDADKARWNKLLKITISAIIIESITSSVMDADTAREFVRDLFDKGLLFSDQSFGSLQLPEYEELLNRDLANFSFKDCIWRRIFRGERVLGKDNISVIDDAVIGELPLAIRHAFRILWLHMIDGLSLNKVSDIKESKVSIPTGLFFATRGVDHLDVSLVFHEQGAEASRCARTVLPCFHSGLDFRLPYCNGSKEKSEIFVKYHRQSEKIRVGLVSWKTSNESWNASVCKMKDPHCVDRFIRMSRIVNDVIKLPPDRRPHYLIFPELALQPRHFVCAARVLARYDVSLLSGVDYIHKPRQEKDIYGVNEATNEVWGSFCADYSRGRSVVLRFIKSQFAPMEKEEAYRLNHLVSQNATKNLPIMVVTHGCDKGAVSLSVLICSDALDINKRALLRGEIDVLAIPAWNKDTNTYAALVDSSAIDVHAYVAQVNNRLYGDTRLRSPAKNEFDRDIVRVRGGTDDYFVIGELDILSLRKFQSYYASPAKPFKPVPTGFAIASNRRVLP